MRVQAGTDAASEKARGLLIDFLAYASAFVAASLLFWRIEDPLIATAVFTAAATVLVYIISVIYSDVSVYDPYWSVAPPVMLVANILKYKLFNLNAVILLLLVGVWAFRLTANWYSTYRGVGHEDWRYAQYRERLSPPAFQFVSFFGLHFVPTCVVYGGMVSALLAIRQEHFTFLSAAGAAVMLLAVNLEYVSDKAIHDFLRDHGEERRTCDVSVWKYSRHPNYLGEMLFWTGLYLYFLPLCPDRWYAGLGFLSIILLFCLVSIPMMERHNMERRADYSAYRAKTPVLIPFPKKARQGSGTRE